MTTKFVVESKVFDDGTIEQTTLTEIDEIRERICTSIVRTQDQQIRECLIKLGWTPPADE